MRTIHVAAMAAASLVASVAQAQQLCGPREGLGALLEQRYGEVPVAAGLVNGMVAELLVSPDGSWTLIQTSPDRSLSCVITGGDGWVEKPKPAAPAEEAPQGKGA